MAESNPTVALLPDHDSLARDPKAIEDYSNAVTQLFESLKNIVSRGEALEEATESILLLEKKARQACDGSSVSKLACKLLELHKHDGQWDTVNDFIVSLCKKRGQLKRAISDMISLGMSWFDDVPNRETKRKLIQTLASIAEGKIFIEVERARLIREEAGMLEEDGKTDEAALLLQEVQVETYGAMDRREKSLYVLDQMRLVLARKDFIRLQIISKKINPKLLEADDFQDIKLQYYRYMVEYHYQEKDYLNTAKAYWSSYQTKTVQLDETWRNFLTQYVILLIMAPHSDESLKLLQELKDNEAKNLSLLPHIQNLLNDFLSKELSDWPLPYQSLIKPNDDFEVPERWTVLRSRFMQHYYSRITTSRAAEFLGIEVREIERCVAELVNDKIIYARIDRPAGIVVFGKPLTSSAQLDLWAADVSEEVTHLIGNDRMVHSALEKRRALLEKSKA